MLMRKLRSSWLEIRVTLRTSDKSQRLKVKDMQMSKVSNDDRLTCEIASRLTNCSSVTGLFFVESSAKDSSNVAMAFESLIKSIH